ncbi:MAG: MotA/TolQ/ExbB proton channel family protein [Elusimicrobiales bacterium]|jgi:chemotaxis protein MotA
MDLASLMGYGMAATVILYGMGQNRNNFINHEGLAIVVGGTVALLLISFSMPQLFRALKALRLVFFPSKLPSDQEIVSEMMSLAEQARRGGISSMKPPAKESLSFLAFAVRTALEKPELDNAKRVLEDALTQQESRHAKVTGVFVSMAALGPLLGLLGTVIGIIQVLRNISNPKVLGPSMAVALTATFYGIAISAVIATPIANKLTERSASERRTWMMIMVGILDILGGAIPLEVERHLQAFSQSKAVK